MNTVIKSGATRVIAIVLAGLLLLGSSGCLPLFIYEMSDTRESNAPVPTEEIQTEGLYNELDFEEICDLLFAHEVSYDNLTFNQLIVNPEALNIETPRPATLGDYSLEATKEDNLFYREILDALDNSSAIDASQMTKQDLASMEQIRRALELAITYEDYHYYSSPLSPSTGMQANLPLSLMDYSFRTVEDIEIYIELLQDTPRLFEQLIAHEKEKETLQVMMPRVSMEDTIEEVKAYIGDADSHILVIAFDEILTEAVTNARESGASDGLAALSDEELQGYKERNREEIERSLVPAYEYLLTELELLLPSCKEGTRLCDYGRGVEYYELEMERMGFVGGAAEAAQTLDKALDDYWEILSTGDAYFGMGVMIPESVVQAIGDTPESYISYIQEHSSKEFAPASNLTYEVKVAPEASPNDYAMAYFLLPPVDDPLKNTIVFFPRNISDDVELFSTMAHEGYPGHMYQIYAYSIEEPQAICKLIGSMAYTEGWAMYAQSRALYTLDTDITGIDAYVAYEKFVYGLQARIDIGVNFEGWSVRDTENYLADWGYEGIAQSLYDVSIQQPVSYLAYGLGVIEFDELRERAEQQLGADFDPVAYHHELTSMGALPFDMLESRVETWLREYDSQTL